VKGESCALLVLQSRPLLPLELRRPQRDERWAHRRHAQRASDPIWSKHTAHSSRWLRKALLGDLLLTVLDILLGPSCHGFPTSTLHRLLRVSVCLCLCASVCLCVSAWGLYVCVCLSEVCVYVTSWSYGLAPL